MKPKKFLALILAVGQIAGLGMSTTWAVGEPQVEVTSEIVFGEDEISDGGIGWEIETPEENVDGFVPNVWTSDGEEMTISETESSLIPPEERVFINAHTENSAADDPDFPAFVIHENMKKELLDQYGFYGASDDPEFPALWLEDKLSSRGIYKSDDPILEFSRGYITTPQLTYPSVYPELVTGDETYYFGISSTTVSPSYSITVMWEDVGADYYDLAIKRLSGSPSVGENESGDVLVAYGTTTATSQYLSAADIAASAGKYIKVYLRAHKGSDSSYSAHYYFKVASSDPVPSTPTLTRPSITAERDGNHYTGYYSGIVPCTSAYTIRWTDEDADHYWLAVKILDNDPLLGESEVGDTVIDDSNYSGSSTSYKISSSNMAKAAGKWIKVYLNAYNAAGGHECSGGHYYFKVEGAGPKYNSQPTVTLNIGGTEYDNGATYGPLSPGDICYLQVLVNNTEHFRRTFSADGSSVSFNETQFTNSVYYTGAKFAIPSGTRSGTYSLTVTAYNDSDENHEQIKITTKTINIRVVGADNGSISGTWDYVDSEYPYPALLDFTTLEDDFNNKSFQGIKVKDMILEQHRQYVLDALEYHIARKDPDRNDYRTAKNLMQAYSTPDGNVLFIFDGVSINLNGISGYQDNIGYIKNNKAYNTSAVAIAVRKDSSGHATIVYADKDVSTTPDYIRKNSNTIDRPTYKDGIYNLIAFNHKGYAAYQISESAGPGYVPSVGLSTQVKSNLEWNHSGIDIHVRYWSENIDTTQSNGQYVSSQASQPSSTGCVNFGASANKGNRDSAFNTFMRVTAGIDYSFKAKDSSSNQTFTSTPTSFGYAYSSPKWCAGIVITDRSNYVSGLQQIIGPDKSGYTAAQIVDALTASSATWHTEILNGSSTAQPRKQPVTETYTVTYNANKGSNAPASQIKIKDVPLLLTADQPTRSGYTFIGWATSSSATSAKYPAGAQNYYTDNANKTLYAVWKSSVVAVTKITLNKTSLTLTEGESATLTATISPSNATNKTIHWYTSNQNVATVSADGVVHAVSAGSATITAKDVNDEHPATCSVTVNSAVVLVTGVSLNIHSKTLNVGESFTLTATVSPSNATNPGVEWESSDSSVASVSSSGVVNAIGSGTAVITAWSTDNIHYDDCVVTVEGTSPVLSGQCGDNLYWTLENGTLTFTGSGAMYDYTHTNRPGWYEYKDQITDVVLPYGITEIGDFSLPDLLNWTGTLTIPPSVTRIGELAFMNCPGLTGTLVIPDSVTTIGRQAFYLCLGFSGLRLSENLQKINNWAFGSCSFLTGTITIPDSVTAIDDYAFYDTNLITELYVGSEVSSIGLGAFDRTLSLTDAYFSGDAPTTVGENIFGDPRDSFTIHYTSGKSGWTTPTWNGYRTSSGTVTVQNVTLDKQEIEVQVGEVFYLTATIEPSDATNYGLRWETGGLLIPCDVGAPAGGTLSVQTVAYQAASAGTTTVTVTTVDGGYTASCTVTVLKSVEGVSLNKSSLNLNVGETATLKATVIPADATNKAVSWKSSKTSVATVSSSGKVTAKGVGTATITVTTDDGGYTAKCTVTVTNSLSITSRPADLTVAVGETARFNVTASGGTTPYTYQWQVSKNGGTTFSPVSSASGKTANFYFTAKTTHNGYMYRCVVTDAAGNTATSNAATLTVVSSPSITSQPTDLTVNVGETARFDVTASGGTSPYTYQWQVSKDSGMNWAPVASASGKTANFYFTAKETHNRYMYRCVVTDAAGMTATSEPATLTVISSLKITSQPDDLTVSVGDTARFNVTASGGTSPYTYQWEKNSGTGWVAVTSASGTTANFNFTAKATHNGYQYRCVVSDSAGNNVTSSAATLTVGTPLKISKQPKSLTLEPGQTAKFSVTATGGTAPYTYQWIYRKTPTTAWYIVSAASGKTANYTLTAQERHNGYQYYCLVMDAAGNAIESNIVTLTVNNPLTITTQPTDQTVDSGKKATFSVTVSGGTAPYAYQWIYRKNASSEWTEVTKNGTSASYVLTTQERHNGYQYYCRVTDAKNTVLNSSVVTLTVNSADAPVITEHPANQVVEIGQKVTFKVTATGTGLTYQWQYLKPGTENWVLVTKNGTSATYTVTTELRHNGYRYRCEVKSSNGKSTISNIAYLGVFEGMNSSIDLDEIDIHYGEDFPILELGELQAELWDKGQLTEEEAQLTVQSGLVAGGIEVIAEDDLPYDPEIGTEPYEPVG